MIPELGYFALILALCFALLQAIFPMIGAQIGKIEWMKSAYRLTLGQFVFVLISFICLAYSLVTNDFSVHYVAENSSALLPIIYRFCALWGAHEGSMLLWLLCLNIWMLFLLFSWKKYPLPFIARTLSILGIISLGFIIFLLWTSSPFDRIFLEIPLEGRDLNPLLQDPGLVSHPPMLYLGYVGFVIPFAFALASLMGKQLERGWAAFARPFSLLAWCFLTIGIVLGSWWAYRQLGWGGWWFWDPVENASFMPWLAGTILIHTLIVIEKRDTFHAWGILIAIVAFALSLLGTFIVRSGVLISVHAFAVDPKRGLFILLFLLFVVGGAFLLYAYHAKKIQSGEHFSLFSKETFLLLNNVGLFAALITVLLGTLYPLIVQVLSSSRISVGPPYFNQTFGFLMLPLLFLMAIAPSVHWKQDTFSRLKIRLGLMLFISILAGTGLPYFLTGSIPFLVFIAVSLAVWIGLSLIQIPYRLLGMTLAHGGMAICLLGIILSTIYTKTQDVQMSIRDHFDMSNYHFELIGIKEINEINYKAIEAEINVTSKAKFISSLKPQIRVYKIQTMALPKAAIEASIFRDIYITLSEPIGDKAWGFRFSYKPFVRWIWVGGILIALGGMISAVRRFIDKIYLKS